MSTWRRSLKRAFGSKAVSASLARVRRDRLVVLCYHDLRDHDDFSSWLRVDRETFQQHLEALAGIGTFVGPDALDESADASPDRLRFLITFDDGYANNLRLGADVLEHFNAPALFFVSTHHLVTGEPFWFDRVVTRLQAARVERLDLSRFGLRDYRFTRKDDAERWEGIEALLSDLKALGNQNHPTVSSVLDRLDSQYGAAAAPYERWLRPITATELKALTARRRMHAGSHGHRHDILTYLDDHELRAGLNESKLILEKMVGTTVSTVAYPNGNHDDRVIDAARALGYTRGFAAIRGLVPRRPDFFRVPRLLVGGYDTPRDLLCGLNMLLLRSGAAAN